MTDTKKIIMKTIEFTQRDWIYRVHQKPLDEYDFEVIDPLKTPKPQYLYKHFSLSKNSIDSLLNNYLYASHPLQLNDPYECNKRIFNLDPTPLSIFQNFLGVLEKDDKKFSIREMFYHQRQELNDLFLESFWQLMYSKCGIVSMSDKPTNIQMWAYYSKLDGFQIKLNTQRIPENFKGPLKLRYSSILKKIPIENNFFLPVLYQMTNKENNWDHESEWRYVVVGPSEMEVPLSIFRNQQKSPHNRKFPYDISALIEVTLGCYFFQPDEFSKIEKNHSLFDLSKSESINTALRINLLNYLVSHPEVETKLIFWEKHAKYELIKVPFRLDKKDDKLFEIWFETEQNVS
jgi:hypothetical protein